ncbi:SNAP receptor [Tieghemiomyces parasiticus]|uniref:Protein transport protein SEC22 n=1 Tax=Tieghemiomyces parasiticus TaxID=78921 RepID=A0A9W8AI21_9FUNG|nr:SNAP receptor [Tieghemiomyces parasiticus]
MVKSTTITRVSDGLPLAATMDDEANESELMDCKNQGKAIIKKLGPHAETRCSIESGKYVLHYLIDTGIVYMCICDRAYPRKLAFSYLDEIAKEFNMSYGEEVHRPGLRPYAFIKFDTFMQKTKTLYQDSRTQHNLGKLNEDLRDISEIMTKNMEDLLWRGDTLERMDTMSENLRTQSLKYRKDAKHLNLQALYRKYGIPAVVFLAFLLLLYIRFAWF